MRLNNTLLKKLFSEQKTDLRLYARFPLVHDRVASITIAGHPLGRVRELSYGGFSVELAPGAETALKGTGDAKNVTLHLLDGRLECQAVKKFENDRFVGFAFVHETLKTYEFLHQYLPFMKFGAALRFLVHGDENGNKKLPRFLAQDESIRASFDIDGYDDSQVPFATIEMTENGFFYKLTRDKQGVHTWHSIGVGGKSDHLRKTTGTDPLVLRKSLCFLLGYCAADYSIPVGKLVLSLLDLAEAETYMPARPKTSNVVPFRKREVAKPRIRTRSRQSRRK